jgi:hypothetical protein
MELFHRDCFDGALVHAGAAIDALVAYDGFSVSHGDGFDWARADARLTSRASFRIHYCWHFSLLFWWSKNDRYEC